MALHEVDVSVFRSYVEQMVVEFIASDMMAAEVDVPETCNSAGSFRNSLANYVEKNNLGRIVRIVVRKDKVYLVRNEPDAVMPE